MTSGICLFIMQVNLQVIGFTGSESLKDMFFQHVHFLFLFISIEIEKEGDEYGGAFKNGRDHQAVWCSLCQ